MRLPINAAVLAALSNMPEASASGVSAFDGGWHLTFETRTGPCDASYDFDVNILNGNISHPTLVRFRGRVSPNGAARASVTVQDKHASDCSRPAERYHGGAILVQAKCNRTWTAHKT